MSWFVRKSNGATFGPVEAETLRHWAMDGRIGPDDELSENQQTWSPAPELDLLGMDWLVEFEDGSEFGPVHLLALRESVESARTPASAVVRHRHTGEECMLAEKLLPAILDLTREQEGKLADLREQLHAGGPPGTGASAHPPPAASPRNGLEPAQALIESHEQLSRNYELMLQQLQQKTEEIRALAADHEQQEKHWQDRLRHLEQQVEKEHRDGAKTRERLAEIEQAYFNLVKAYREMNDRFIRLRHQGQPPIPPQGDTARPSRG